MGIMERVDTLSPFNNYFLSFVEIQTTNTQKMGRIVISCRVDGTLTE